MAQPMLSADQTKKAIAALLKYVGKEAQESKALFDDDEMLCLVRLSSVKSINVLIYRHVLV